MNEQRHIIAPSPLEGWARIFLNLMQPGCESLPATMVSIMNPSHETVTRRHPLEEELSSLLRENSKPVVRETSAIIFPYAQWRAKGWNIGELTDWYLGEFMPRLGKVSPRHGKTYFNRLVNYSGLRQTKTDERVLSVNQLEKVIQFSKNAAKRGAHFRESGLQMAIFDPAKDLTESAQSNFPCLHQIGLSFDSNGGLQLSAFYPTQYVVERALGNYLGLCQLGLFIASELNIPFAELTCFIATPQRGTLTKTALRGLENSASKYLEGLTPSIVVKQS
jgi:hypothetical protein